MGLVDYIINGLNALANLKKADAEQTKARVQKDKIRSLKRENKQLKKNLSRNNIIGIIGLSITILGIIIVVLAYFPIHNTP